MKAPEKIIKFAHASQVAATRTKKAQFKDSTDTFM